MVLSKVHASVEILGRPYTARTATKTLVRERVMGSVLMHFRTGAITGEF